MNESTGVDNLVMVVPAKKANGASTLSPVPSPVEKNIPPLVTTADATSTEAPVANSSNLTEPTRQEAPIENFRTQLTEKYNWFLQHFGGLINGRVMIYEIPGFSGDWTNVSPLDYFAYRLSIKGLKPENGQASVTLQQVTAELDNDKAIGLQRGENLRSALRMYYGVQDDSKLELNNFVWVNHPRMRDLVRNAEFPAAGAFKYGDHVGVLLNAESVKNMKEFLAEVVHEVGHFERLKSGKDDTNKDPKTVRLEEGIVQANARKIAEKGGFQDARSLEIYDFETMVAAKLAEKLGVDLMNYSHAEIEQLMKLSPSMSKISSDPYHLLVDNLDAYLISVKEVDKAGDTINEDRLKALASQFNNADNTIDTMLK